MGLSPGIENCDRCNIWKMRVDDGWACFWCNTVSDGDHNEISPERYRQLAESPAFLVEALERDRELFKKERLWLHLLQRRAELFRTGEYRGDEQWNEIDKLRKGKLAVWPDKIPGELGVAISDAHVTDTLVEMAERGFLRHPQWEENVIDPETETYEETRFFIHPLRHILHGYYS